MKLKNNWKRFWTLDRHHAAGFTLVELIVVIAILAILAGVGIPVYSGYITKANKQSDITLIRDVQNALTLAFYNQKLPNGGYVILSKDGIDETSSEDVNHAIIAAFGSVESVAGLKFDGWGGDFANTDNSFHGKETELTVKVEGLTESLAAFLKDNKDVAAFGGNFGGYMREQLNFSEADMENDGKVADAAVLYVANSTHKLTDKQKTAFENIGNLENTDTPLALMDYLQSNVYGDSVFLVSAAAYAMMTGYCEYAGVEVNDVNASLITNGGSMQDMQLVLGTAFAGVTAQPDWNTKWKEYLKTQAAKDAVAFMDVMGTVNDAKSQIVGSLGTPYDEETGKGCFNSETLQLMFNSYGSGKVMVFANIDDGTLETSTMPETINAES